ncbi:MAG: calcium-binding EGF-like domain-containing protein [Bacteroidota bacterium]
MRPKILFFICTLAFASSQFSSCKSDPCEEQYCLNGGDCVDGNCFCPPEWEGEHCEISLTTYDCVDGKCFHAYSWGAYASLGECQAACETNTSGYNCMNGNCVYTEVNSQYLTLSSCQSSCAAATPTISYLNRSFTDMSITINGDSRVIAPGGTAIFSGAAGATAQGEASTSGRTSSGTPLGTVIEWNLNHIFPSSGNSEVNLNVSLDYFFLRMRNNGSAALNNFRINEGLAGQATESISIPNDNTIYNIGYYRAYTNTNVKADLQGTSTFITWRHNVHFTLTFLPNQSTTLYNDNFREEEREVKG